MDSQKDIQGLKKECNLLIDKVMSLQAQDQELSEKIRLLMVKKDGSGSRDGMAAKTEHMAKDSLEADRQTSPEDTLMPGESTQRQEHCSETDEPYVKSDSNDVGFPGEKGQKENTEDVRKEKEVGEGQKEKEKHREEALKRQIGLLSDSKEIVVVYEKGRAARTLGQIMRTLAFLALLLLVAVVISFALYYADRNGGFF